MLRSENRPTDSESSKPGVKPLLGPRIFPISLRAESKGLCTTGDGTPLHVGPSGIQKHHPNGKNGSELYTNNGATGIHMRNGRRVSVAQTLDPNNVLRFNYGRFTQPTQTAYEQYTNASGLGAAKFDYTYFWGLGWGTATHDNPVQVSNRYDLSYKLANTDVSMKTPPF